MSVITGPRLRFAAALRADPLVQQFAWFVVAGQLVVWLYFVTTPALYAVTTAMEPICWPYFEDCWRVRLASPAALYLVILVHGLLLAGVTLALWRRNYPVFWVLLATLNLGVFGVMSLDYRLRANELYMLLWLNGVFLVWPGKRWALPAVIVAHSTHRDQSVHAIVITGATAS